MIIKHRLGYRIALLCLLILGATSSGWAQQTKSQGKSAVTGKTAKTAQSADQLLTQAEEQYRLGNLVEATKSLDQYRQHQKRKRQELSPEAVALGERLSRAEHYQGIAEEVVFTDSIQCPLSELSERLRDLTTGRIELRHLDGGKLITAFATTLGGQRIENKLSGDQLDLIRMYLIGTGWEVDNDALSPLNSPRDEAFPYLLSDGITLLFGRDNSQGSEGFGEYDIYFSRLNWERNTFYEPTLLGFPYNSPANDYLLAYDEELGLGYLVTDRGVETAGEVRIYQFRGLPKALGASSVIEPQG